MLIEFSVENWMSFKDKAIFSMVANNELDKQESHLAHFSSHNSNVLPVAAMYGANGSGKTSFFSAITFVRSFVLRGYHDKDHISVKPFCLNENTLDEPSAFSIVFIINEQCYQFSFSASERSIITEELNIILSDGKSKNIYTRNGQEIKVQEGSPVEGMEKYAKDRQLFLTTAIRNNQFVDIQTWFNSVLTPLSPDKGCMSYEKFTQDGSSLLDGMNKLLSKLGTGIAKLSSVPLSTEEFNIKSSALPPEGTTLACRNFFTKERIFVSRKDGEVSIERLVSKRFDDEGRPVIFSIVKGESPGTQRLIDLLPLFVEHENGIEPRVFIMDELDRGFHSHITKTLLSFFLANCSKENRNQLIFTTYDTALMDLGIFRRDEIWMTEKTNGKSRLFSLNDYKVRADKDVQKDYLSGIYGGIPTILLER